MTLLEKEISAFVTRVKELSVYDFSEYSIKSLTRRITKVLNDRHLDLVELLIKIENDPLFLESVIQEIRGTVGTVIRAAP